MPGGKGLCRAVAEGTTTAATEAEAVAELYLQLMRRTRVLGSLLWRRPWAVQPGGGPVGTAWIHNNPHPPRPTAPGCSSTFVSI